MKHSFAKRIRNLFIFLVIIFIIICVIVWQKYSLGVKQYKTISLGMRAAEGAGTHTVWASPDDIVPKSDFYIYALGDKDMCIGSNCGLEGYFIECLGGYLSGYKVKTEEFDYGLRDAGVDMEQQTIITIADKNAKIVGIYPGAHIKNLPHIMRNHHDLVIENKFKKCLYLLSRQ